MRTLRVIKDNEGKRVEALNAALGVLAGGLAQQLKQLISEKLTTRSALSPQEVGALVASSSS